MKTRRREIRKRKTTEKKETDPGVQEDANQGLLPLEGGRRLSEESGNAATLAPLITELRAVVLLLHQKRKRRLLSQNPL
uniref:Uncharacterized protein n=1 Tax=Strix occidentalis caurina TaxID=311401 RepID=A0A8D0F6U5_STROC